jgi:hypothetical protein
MQLTLSSTPFAKPPVAAKPAPQPARPRDAAALSQLDQIAAQNLQASRQGLGGAAIFLALVGGLVILGSASMWNSGGDEVRKPLAAADSPKAAVAETPLMSAVAAPPATAAVVVPTSPGIAAPTVQATEPAPAPVQATVAAPEVLVAADDAARKARAKQQAEARRKAAQLAQERALAEETQRLQLAQQREAERAQQLAEQARQRAAAAEQARLAAAQLASDSRRNVGDMCSAAGGFISQQFCHARECRKAEHQGDGICVNLRETEAARLRASAER